MDTLATSEAADGDLSRKATTNSLDVIDLTVPSPNQINQSAKPVCNATSHTPNENASTTIAAQSSNGILVPSNGTPTPVKFLPDTLIPKSTGLRLGDFTLLQAKQRLLRTTQIPGPLARFHADAVNPTLVFAQACAGTAVCISPQGLLLTCAHCVAQDAVDFAAVRKKAGRFWLLFASGQIVQAECLAWDLRRDLALLQIVAAQRPPHTASSPSKSLSSSPPLPLNPTCSPFPFPFRYISRSPLPRPLHWPPRLRRSRIPPPRPQDQLPHPLRQRRPLPRSRAGAGRP